jgi:hypothetical protein
VVHEFKTSGEVGGLAPACAAESAALLKDMPDFWKVSEVTP